MCRKRSGLLFPVLLVSAGMVGLLYSPGSRAWSYEEHVKITLGGFRDACNDTHAQELDASVGYACNVQFQVCFAHLVAIAGDHAEDAASLLGELDRQPGYLKNKVLDCRETLMQPGKTTAGKNAPLEQAVEELLSADATGQTAKPFMASLVPSSLGNWWNWASLASRNPLHFQPDSARQWQLGSERLLTQSGQPITPTRLFEAAFAMHFLEDSFPSGHIGLDRKLQSHQDYGNAYHDDFNGAGRFLRNSQTEWYGYGDNHLTAHPTWYLEMVGAGSGTLDDLKAALPGYDFRELSDADIAGAASPSQQEAGPRILSVPAIKGQLRGLCFFWDNCEKLEIVLVKAPLDANRQKHCTPRALELSKSVLWRCDGETEAPARTAAAHALRAVLLSLAGRPEEAAIAQARAAATLPCSYRPLTAPPTGRTTINKMASVVGFGAWTPADHFVRQPTTEWGFALENRTSDVAWLEGSALSWSIRLNDLLEKFGARGDSDAAKEVTSDDANAAAFSQRSRSSARIALQNRYEVINEDGDILNSFEIASYFDRLRIQRQVIGIAPKVTVGVDSIWDGSHKRNYYGGAGVSIDFHLGKRIMYFDFDQRWHQNGPLDNEPSFRATIGFRVMSVDLN